MDKVKVTFPSDIHHLCQIAAGFIRLKEQGWDVEIVNEAHNQENPFHGLPIAFAEYKGKRIAYDLWDGYQNPNMMRLAAENCDFYFKRSYAENRNEACFGEYRDRVYPLGFNYHVTVRNNPINEPLWKQLLKPLFGRAPDIYFTPEVFEGKADRKNGEPVKILFLTRLWEDDPQLPEEVNTERRQINQSRIHMIRTLKERYGDAFLGGLNDLPIARDLAPDLIVPAKFTERKHYVKLLHESDICIGTIGLHESIGWKTGEYVAAAKAIVNERFHYDVTGDFAEGKNYLPFATAQDCIDAVQQLVDSPEKLYEMKKANEDYYRQYLKPEALIRNTLVLVEKNIEKNKKES